MPTIYLQLRSMSDAEDAIVETWAMVEEYDLPSPGMTFSFRGRSRMNIALSIDDPVAAHTLTLRLVGWAPSKTGGMAAPLEMPAMKCSRLRLSSLAPSRFLNPSHDRHRRPHAAIRFS
jgi:hypothetical protein